MKLRFGVPYGSLNHPQRWKTVDYLQRAGLYIEGYEPGERTFYPLFTGDAGKILEAVAIRPQRVPQELWAQEEGNGSRGADMAITGSDMADEGTAAGYPIEAIGALGYGKVRLYVATLESSVRTVSDLVRKFARGRRQLICASEYTHMTKKLLLGDPEYRKRWGETEPTMIRDKKVTNARKKPNPMVRVIYSEGTTELNLPSGFAHMIVDNAQSSRTAKANRLKILQELGTSYARLYVGPHLTPEDSRWDTVLYVRDRLRGAALARKFKYYTFNFSRGDRRKVQKFLEKHGLYTVKPVIKTDNGVCETSILVPVDKDFMVVEGLKRQNVEALTEIEIKSLIPPFRKPGKDEDLAKLEQYIDGLIESNDL